ncbi:hypothetical protein QBC35DRAFT_179873 [Podospora australis]|uniref:Uncharacterized protein n=1 Tax=Podospora australis TaxID=1536484 RepID=A0AAN6WX33_9PEZI|nr:hypothetical protein QBC35DRAFT_179873 [Podospora australis]
MLEKVEPFFSYQTELGAVWRWCLGGVLSFRTVLRVPSGRAHTHAMAAMAERSSRRAGLCLSGACMRLISTSVLSRITSKPILTSCVCGDHHSLKTSLHVDLRSASVQIGKVHKKKGVGKHFPSCGEIETTIRGCLLSLSIEVSSVNLPDEIRYHSKHPTDEASSFLLPSLSVRLETLLHLLVGGCVVVEQDEEPDARVHVSLLVWYQEEPGTTL